MMSDVNGAAASKAYPWTIEQLLRCLRECQCLDVSAGLPACVDVRPFDDWCASCLRAAAASVVENLINGPMTERLPFSSAELAVALGTKPDNDLLWFAQHTRELCAARGDSLVEENFRRVKAEATLKSLYDAVAHEGVSADLMNEVETVLRWNDEGAESEETDNNRREVDW